MVLKGGRVVIKGKVYHHNFLNEWVGKKVEITTWEHEMCPGELFYRAQPLGEELFLCLSESKLPQDREEGEVLAGRDEAIVEIREIIEKFQYDNPAQDRLVLDILECVGKLALPGYSVQVIASRARHW